MNPILEEPKLFMVLLGSKAPGRTVEQHDLFFGVGTSLKGLVPAMRAAWPEAGSSLHIDGWREVRAVDGYAVSIKQQAEALPGPQLFFINLGGYRPGKLEEQHEALLTVQPDMAAALKHAKQQAFYKQQRMKGAPSHVDDKYAFDVDEVYAVDALLVGNYCIVLTPSSLLPEDEIVLGYFKPDQLP